MNSRSNPLEMTLRAVLLGILLSVLLGAANTYLGLYAGMTVSASIPAAVISMSILRGLIRRGSILENNMVQTIASAGESLAAGVIFTIPALIMIGVWEDFHYIETTCIALAGGILGIVFMIPLRRTLIVEDTSLRYPEGVACAEVLKAGQSGNSRFSSILIGMLAGGLIKFASAGLGLFKGAIEACGRIGGRIIYFGMDASPALIAVGYIVNLEVAVLIFAGGFIGWNIALPILSNTMAFDGSAIDAASTIWSTKIRYIGVGAMLVGGVSSIFSIRKGISTSLSKLFRSRSSRTELHFNRTDRDLSLRFIFGMLLAALTLIVPVYHQFLNHWPLSIISTIIVIIAAFFFVAVSSFIVGLVGSSNNPVSGMTICALLGAAVLLALFQFSGPVAAAATLGIAGVVCCAACAAGDMSQDLKTGYLVGATPRNQQIGEIIGIVSAAVILAPVLTLLHHAYGIGIKLKAPQAALFASLSQGFFGSGSIPHDMIAIGILGSIIVLAFDHSVLKRSNGFRLHIMPIAVGLYLPISLSTPILLGGLIRFASESRRFASESSTESTASDHRVLLSSGLIAGESIAGILLAFLIYLGWNSPFALSDSDWGQSLLTLATIAMIICLGLLYAIPKSKDVPHIPPSQ